MKELKIHLTAGDIIRLHYPIPRRKNTKRWKIAQTRGVHPAQVGRNECVEASYHEVLTALKSHYLTPGEIYYERDLKHVQDDWLGMHSFVSEHFYWQLYCAAYYDYEIEFAFNDCPYESEIRKMFRAYPLDRQAKEIQLQPDYATFYRRVLSIQPAEFIFSFKRELL